jgi:hypothetical protein
MHSTILFLRQMAVEDHVEDDAFPAAEIEFILNFQQFLQMGFLQKKTDH